MNDLAPQPAATHQLSEGPMRLRRHRLYFLLAAFDVFTVSISLYLNHRIMTIYMHSVEVNQGWAEILRDTSRLGQLIAAINAPGNNVFESRQVEAEAEAMRQARDRFGDHLTELRKQIEAGADTAWTCVLFDDLAAVQRAAMKMADEAEQLFAVFPRDAIEAGNRMAAMDRRYDDAHTALFSLREHIGTIQKELFASQTAAAASLQKFEYLIAGLILLMVGGATYYGYQTAKQEEADAQERERARQRKQAMEARTRMLKQVMTAQEEERRRIARDLHDEIGQCLTSLLMGLRAVGTAPTATEVQAQVEELRQIALRALDEVRRMARGLRPSVLDDLGLAAALERCAADYAQAHGIAVEVQAPGLDECRLPEAVETALYRIAQEALNNVAKHAAAQNVRLHVERQPGQVQMTVADDGCGFEVCTALTDRGLGLSGMRERAALLDGAITVESKPGVGTRITVLIPLTGVAHGENSRAHCG